MGNSQNWDDDFKRKMTHTCKGDPATGIFDQLEIEFTLSSVKLLTRMLLYRRDRLSNPATYRPSPVPRLHSCDALCVSENTLSRNFLGITS